MPPESGLMPQNESSALQVPCATQDAEIVETVKLVSLMWTEVLQRSDAVSLEENFFEAGGDSLAMMMLLFRVKEELEVDLAPVALMEAPTLRQFSHIIHVNRSALSGSDGVIGPDRTAANVKTASQAEPS